MSMFAQCSLCPNALFCSIIIWMLIFQVVLRPYKTYRAREMTDEYGEERLSQEIRAEGRRGERKEERSEKNSINHSKVNLNISTKHMIISTITVFPMITIIIISQDIKKQSLALMIDNNNKCNNQENAQICSST